MEEALVALLLGSAPVAAMVGTRVNWNYSPQSSEMPRIVLRRVSSIRVYCLNGTVDLVETRVQADCFGMEYSDTLETSRALIAVLNGYKGGDIQGIFLDGERDIYIADSNASERINQISVDIIVHHT